MVNNSGIVSDGRPSSLSLDIIFHLLFMDKYIWDAIIFSLIQNCILYFGQSKVSFLELKKKNSHLYYYCSYAHWSENFFSKSQMLNAYVFGSQEAKLNNCYCQRANSPFTSYILILHLQATQK